MSPSLYRHRMNKEKIDAMVKSAYKEKSDSVKVGRYRALKSNLSVIVYQMYTYVGGNFHLSIIIVKDGNLILKALTIRPKICSKKC